MFDLMRAWKELEEIRLKKILSYRELADDIGISKRTIFKIKANPARTLHYKTQRIISDYLESESK